MLEQYVTYKTALELAVISSSGLQTWKRGIYTPEMRLPTPDDLTQLSGAVDNLLEVSNEYFTEEQAEGLKALFSMVVQKHSKKWGLIWNI